MGGLEAEHEDGGRAVAGAGGLGLERVEEAAVGRVEAGLGELADGLGAPLERVEADAAGELRGRPRAHADPGLGDHAERALRADQEPVGAGARPGSRQAAALPVAGRGDRPHRLDQVVDVGIERREMPAGAGGHPAAQRGVLEGLREVAEREAALAQVVLQRRAEHPALDSRRGGDLINLQDAVEAAEVDRDGAAVGIPHPRLDAADDAGAAAVGDRRQPVFGAPAEHGLELGLGPGARDQVGRVLELAAEPTHDIAIGLAERARDAVVAVVAQHAGQCARHLDPRRAQLDVLERDGLLDALNLEAEALVDRLGGVLQSSAVGLLVLPAPAPVLAPARQAATRTTSARPASGSRTGAGGYWPARRSSTRLPPGPASSCRPSSRRPSPRPNPGRGGRRC